jgi:hypothetical protein
VPAIRVSASAIVTASAAATYGLIADYRNGHPRILPTRYFGTLEVLRGGRGEGTRIRFEMKTFGMVNVVTAAISEPVPGRQLVETLPDGIVTTFLVEPLDEGRCRVSITTDYSKPGWRGWLERSLAPIFLRRVYVAELAQLARVATGVRDEPA